MKILRTGWVKGAWQHRSIVPRLVFQVRGWPWLLADCLGLRRRPYRLCTKSGADCELRPGTSDWWIFLEIFVFGIYQRVQDDIRRAKVVIDVGANVGFFALYAASINSGAEIHAFEPFPDNLAQAEKNFLIGLARRVRVHPCAVSDKTGVAVLYFTPGDDSGCSLNQPKSQSCPVTAVGINDLFKTCGVTNCDLLKMDCEGSELAILSAAAPDVLAKIEAIIMEYHNPAEVDTLTAILSHAGFKYEILPQIHTLYACRS
jgi:FkbM family methyltransferase